MKHSIIQIINSYFNGTKSISRQDVETIALFKSGMKTTVIFMLIYMLYKRFDDACEQAEIFLYLFMLVYCILF